jgi:SMC interacting uncharacterized protein involved in chromosome segregation
MISDDAGRNLHDRLTRGEPLSSEEQSLLEEWYALQDDAERQLLGLSGIPDESNITTIQTQVDAALAQLAAMTARIQEIASENTALKQEISELRHQLTHQNFAMPAAV